MLASSSLLLLALLAPLSSVAADGAVDGEISFGDGHIDPAAVENVDDIDEEPNAAKGDDEEGGLFGDIFGFGRAAATGPGSHSTIAAGKQIRPEERKFGEFQPIHFKPGGSKQPAPPGPPGPPPPPFFNQKPGQPIAGLPPFLPPLDNQQRPVVDPVTGLAFLEYVRFLLEQYPKPGSSVSSGGGISACDFTRFGKCTCMSPAVYTHDGRGNCNLGVTKPDKQVSNNVAAASSGSSSFKTTSRVTEEEEFMHDLYILLPLVAYLMIRCPRQKFKLFYIMGGYYFLTRIDLLNLITEIFYLSEYL